MILERQRYDISADFSIQLMHKSIFMYKFAAEIQIRS